MIYELVSVALRDGSGSVRCHFNKLPRERVLPAVVITVVSGSNDMDMEGDDTLRSRIVQLDAWASTRTGADNYMEEARGQMLAATTFVVGDIRESGADHYDEEANLYRASLEFDVGFNA
jgi:hypothetical protein